MSHSIDVPDLIWEWAQRKYQKKVPATDLRNLLHTAMIEDIQGKPVNLDWIPRPRPTRSDNEVQWAELGCVLDEFDTDFTMARHAWVAAHGDETKAINYLIDSV